VQDYDRLEREPTPKSVRDWTAKWDTFESVGSVNGQIIERLELFCAAKRISVGALAALDTRVVVRSGGKVELAFAGRNDVGTVTAIKYRPLDGTSHDSKAEEPSTWLHPIVAGRLGALDWFVAEGETDGARLYDLVGDVAAVLVLPAGAKAFKPRWADVIPRGASVTVHLCHDADADGDAGAAKTARILGGRTVRVRPPVEGGDWCDWTGTRDDFMQLVGAARGEHAASARPFSMPLREFLALERPNAESLLADTDGRPIVAAYSLTLLGAFGGQGKTTWFIDVALHLAAGVDYAPFTVPRPVSILVIENEGPEQMFADKLAARLEWFPHELKARVDVCTIDWGGFSLADNTMRDQLRQEIAEHEYDLVFGDPLDSLGIEGVGSPEDTRKFLKLMKETGLNRNVAWWLNTHPRKEETKEAINEISGAWGGKPDAILLLKMLADDRTLIRYPKLRWAKRGKRPSTLHAFNAETEAFSYLGEVSEDERNYLAEVTELFADGEWRTAKEVSAPADGGGIGANIDVIKKVLKANPDTFESRTGDAAKSLNRSPRATLWQLTRAAESVESVTLFTGCEGEA
jgi:hypothetical protein